jgi:hypothetical protein
MLEEQRIGGLPVVIEGEFFPIPFDVAILALDSEAALMDVDLLVTGIAKLGRFLVVVIQVALEALHLIVTSQQFIFGFAVIESKFFPGLFGMASFTIRSHHALVLVALLVALVAN